MALVSQADERLSHLFEISAHAAGRRSGLRSASLRSARRFAAGASFGAAQVAAETNRRYRDKLDEPLDARAVSVTLRRLRDAGRLREVREGKSYHEALYVKAARPAAAKPPSPTEPQG